MCWSNGLKDGKKMKTSMKKFGWFLLGLVLFASCKKEVSNLSDLKSNFYALKQTPTHLGENLKVEFGANADKIDSVLLILNGKELPNDVKLDLTNSILGMNKIQLKVFVGDDFVWGETEIPILNPEKETSIEYTVLKEYPHNTELFTQGLFFHNNLIYESGGQYKRSKLVNYKLGATSYNKELKMNDETFAEGITLFNHKIYQITYRQKDIFVYDATTFELLETLRMPDMVREGWGITSNGKELLVSDGTQNIYFFDEKFNFQRKIQVVGNVSIYTNVNELEYINNRIYANIWTTNFVLIINPESGAVEQYYDFTPLSETKGSDDVLNGIAAVGKNLVITGKNWTKLYEIENKIVE
jgi:glutamine cyclotransferase